MSSTLKKIAISNFFYYIHSVEIPTDTGTNSYKLKLSKIWNGHPMIDYLNYRLAAYHTRKNLPDEHLLLQAHRGL